MKRVLIVIGLVLLISTGVGSWHVHNEQQGQLEEAQDKIVLFENQFEEYKIEAGRQMENLQDELNASVIELHSTVNELENSKIQFQNAELNLEAQEKRHEQRLKEERELSYKAGYGKGYEEGYEEGKESVLPKKPTYAQAVEMSKKIQVWAASPAVCTIVAMEAREAWRKEGWKVGVASIRFWGIGGHLVVVFDTVDKGEIYLDIFEVDGVFREVKVEEGKSYTRQNGLPGPGFDDTVFKVITMW